MAFSFRNLFITPLIKICLSLPGIRVDCFSTHNHLQMKKELLELMLAQYEQMKPFLFYKHWLFRLLP